MQIEALQAHLWGTPPAPARFEDIPQHVLVVFIEGLARRTDEGAKTLDGLYAQARRGPVAPMTSQDRKEQRRQQIEAFTGAVAGAAVVVDQGPTPPLTPHQITKGDPR